MDQRIGYSLILALQYHGVIPGYVVDYMHSALLGVTKTMLMMWFSPSKENRGKDFFIGEEVHVPQLMFHFSREQQTIILVTAAVI